MIQDHVLFEIRISKGLALRYIFFLMLAFLCFSFINVSSARYSKVASQLSMPMLPLVESSGSPLPFVGDLSRGIALIGLGDFNEDGFTDAVGTSNNTLQILDGNEKGTFTMPRYTLIGNNHDIFKGEASFSLMTSAISDLNNDSHLDIVFIGTLTHIGDTFEKQLYVYLGDGDGFFGGIPSVIDLSGDNLAVFSLVVSDVDNDGLKDVLVGSILSKSTPTIQVFQGNTDGTFDVDRQIDLGLRLPPKPLQRMINTNLSPGNGSEVLFQFEDEIRVLTLDEPHGNSMLRLLIELPEDEKIRQLVVSDFNGDQHKDIILVREFGRVLDVYFQKDAEFKLGQSYELDFNLNTLDVGDFNGDGFVDLIFVSTTSQVFSVVLGKGNGLFNFKERFDSYVGLPIQRFLVQDLNANGRDDVVLETTYMPLLFLNQNPPQGLSQILLNQTLLLGSADFDGDQRVDLIVGSDNVVEIFKNNGQGALTGQRLLLENQSQYLSQGLSIDLNQDGRKEFVILGLNFETSRFSQVEIINALKLHVLGWNTDTATVEEQGVFSVIFEEGPPNLAKGDLNGDGFADVVTTPGKQSVVIWFGNGNGNLAPEKFPLEQEIGFISIADFDQDGIDELVVTVGNNPIELKLFKFANKQLNEIKTLTTLEFTPIAIHSGTLDHDNLKDILILSTKFSFEVQKIEGQADQLLVDVPSARVLRLLNRGQLEFDQAHFEIMPWKTGSFPWPYTGLALGDFDLDQQQDVAYALRQGEFVPVLTEFSENIARSIRNLPCQGGPLLAADLDGNGQDELITSTFGLPLLCISWNGGGLK